MLPNPAEWGEFYHVVDSTCGIDLANYKQHQTQRRILGMVQSRHLQSLQEFGDLLVSDQSEMRWFLDKLAINVSELFRNPDRWETLRTAILPQCLARSSRLRIWSAGCSYGAEAYTLAILLQENYPGTHTILGTDIDESALDQANAGIFNESDLKSVPQSLRSRYFELRQGKWQVSSVLRRYVSFERGNLFEGGFKSGFDLIVCRNVVIYFNEDSKDQLYRRFHQALKPGGYLFVGSTERVGNYAQLGFEPQSLYFYRKSIKEDQAWRNAS